MCRHLLERLLPASQLQVCQLSLVPEHLMKPTGKQKSKTERRSGQNLSAPFSTVCSDCSSQGKTKASALCSPFFTSLVRWPKCCPWASSHPWMSLFFPPSLLRLGNGLRKWSIKFLWFYPIMNSTRGENYLKIGLTALSSSLLEPGALFILWLELTLVS